MGTFEVTEDEIIIRIKKAHPQVLPFYPEYNITKKSPLAIEDYARIDNCVGHTQRSWLTYWSLRAFAESDGIVCVDLGSAGVQHPGCISTDRIGTGEIPEYGGIMEGVQIKADANNIPFFCRRAFSGIFSLHLIEHIKCLHISSSASFQQRKNFMCNGYDLINVVRNWIYCIKQGGYVGFITPDNDVAIKNGITSFDYDHTHEHALSGTEFCALLEQELHNEVEIIEANTLLNNFSFNWLARKK